MDNDKFNLGTFVPKDTSSQSVRGTEVSWCAEALARWTVGRPPKRCFFFLPGRYTPLRIWYGYPRLLYFQGVTFLKPSFFVKCLRMFFWVYRGVHLFFILALYVWKNLLCFIWFISSVTRCIFLHVDIHHIIDMYINVYRLYAVYIASRLPWFCFGQHLSFKYHVSGCVQRKGSQLQLPVKHVEWKFDRINGKIHVHK